MSAQAPPASAARRVVVGAGICLAAALATVAWCAGIVVICDAQARFREFFAFGFDGLPRTPAQVLAVAKTNGSLAAIPLIAAAINGLLHRVRAGVDAVLGALLLTNSALIGFSLGAYGLPIAGALALHVPLEFSAFALAGGAYIAATRALLPARALAVVTALCTALVLLAACVETYAPPGTL